jgi:hypothetical protein
MNPQALEQCLTSIENVFEQEANYIVAGQLFELGELSQSKFAHLSNLSDAIEAGALKGQSPDLVKRVARLQKTADEHGRHLQAMQHGLKRVLGRLDRLQSDSQVGSYDNSGSKIHFSGAQGRFNSKA